jgi:hypothetical protein
MQTLLKKWLRSFTHPSEDTTHSFKDINEALAKAREAWLDVMQPYQNSLGFIPLPHSVPTITEKHLENCCLLSGRETILKKMKPGGVIAEVGVLTGDFSRSILDLCSPSKLHLIDINLRNSVHERFRTEIDAGVIQLHQGDSSSILEGFPNNYFDFIYIDADHNYPGVKRDIQAGKSKVKQDGFLIFNDYTYWSPIECMPYGVIQAVNEVCIEDNWEMIYFALGYYMYCDVALKRKQGNS